MAAQIPFGWSVRSRRPIDDRFIVEDATELTSLDTFRRHIGLSSYNKDDNKTYKLIGGVADADWKEVLDNIGVLVEDNTLTDADWLVWHDSATDTHYKISVKNFFSGFPTKSIPVGADKIVIIDSEDGDSIKEVAISTLPSSSGGEVNTASNLGSGSGVFASKVGVDLQFKSLIGGTNVTLSASSTGITINATDTNTTYTAGTGLQLIGTQFSNTDRGSSQNIFKNIAVSGQSTVVADSNNDTLTLVAGSNVTITTNASTDAITINATDTNTTYTAGTGLQLIGTEFSNTDRGSSQNIFKNIAVSGQSTVVADSNNDTLTLVAGSNVTITTNATTDEITIAAASAPVTSVNGETGVVVLDATDVGAEPAFTKGSLAFGTGLSIGGTGADRLVGTGTLTIALSSATQTSLANGDTAFSWGDHATEGYLKVVNLGYTASPTNGIVTNSGGTDATIPLVTTTNAGLMIPADKTKLDGVAANANNYVHPTGFTNEPSVALTGANVISRILVSNEGHVTGVDTRALAISDFSAVGSDRQIIFNDSGSFGASSKFRFEESAGVASLIFRPSESSAVTTDVTIKNEIGNPSRMFIESDVINLKATTIGFYSSAGAVKQTITGDRQGNAALASFLTSLSNLGLITDSTTAGTAPAGSKWTEVTNGIYRNGRVAINKSSVGTTYPLDVNGVVYAEDGFRNANPSGTTAATWELGQREVGSVTPDGRITVVINGVLYFIPCETALS